MSALPRITACLIAELLAQPVRRRPGEVGFAESAKLEHTIKANLRGLGYGG